jgi:protein SCO1/2
MVAANGRGRRRDRGAGRRRRLSRRPAGAQPGGADRRPDFKGHPFLVYFGYTHCPDVCPSTLADIADAMRKIPDAPIRVLFVTVDPARDSPAAMADYVSSFDARFVGLSGSPEQIAAAEKAYRVYARKGPPQSDGGYSMDHSSIVYLMDKNGLFVESLDLQRPAEDTAKELSAYL